MEAPITPRRQSPSNLAFLVSVGVLVGASLLFLLVGLVTMSSDSAEDSPQELPTGISGNEGTAVESSKLASPPQTTASQISEPIDVTFDFSVDWDGSRPIINGNTNLPDGTEIAASVVRPSPRFAATERVVVRAGRFRAGPFGPTSGLAPGNYVADATMSYTCCQPQSVRAIVGDKGENLHGPLIERRESLGAALCVERSFTWSALGNFYCRPQKSVPARSSIIREWYEGGTLQDKGILDWQKASYENKLGTCGDLVARFLELGYFKPGIQHSIESVDDMRPYAEELVVFLDTATKKWDDPEENRVVFTNQTVPEFAFIGLVLMEWIDPALRDPDFR
jgi:hypothetical protein